MEGSKKCPDCCGREEVNSLFSESGSGSARVSSWCWQVAGVSVDQSEARRVFSLTNQKPGFCQSLDEFEGSHDMNPSLGSGYQAVMYRLILSELKLDIVTLSSNWPLMQLRPVSPLIGWWVNDEASDWLLGPHWMARPHDQSDLKCPHFISLCVSRITRTWRTLGAHLKKLCQLQPAGGMNFN